MLFSKDNPGRPPDWRWKKASWLRENGAKYMRSQTDDPETKVIRDYQTLKSKCKNDVDFFYLSTKYPGIYWAEHIRDNLEMTKYTLEARLLANESVESIVKKIGCTPDAVIWYENTFFNVLPYLEQPDYIVHIVMGEAVHKGLYARQFDLLWKLVGYCRGPILLDHYVQTMTRAPITEQDQIKDAQADILRETIARKGVVAATTLPVAYNEGTFLEFYYRQLEIEKTAGVDGGAQSTIINNIGCTLKEIPFALQRNTAIADKLNIYDTSSVELRAHELLAVSADRETAEHRELVELKFPEGAKDGQSNKQDH